MLGDGSQWGIDLVYKEQNQPRGIAEAFRLGADFVGDDSVCLILGDNIFYGEGLPQILRRCAALEQGAMVFAYAVRDPERYGVVDFDEDGTALSIVEKPQKPKSHYAVPGIYFYDNKVIKHARDLQPSPRGELEITDINQIYLKAGALRVEALGRGYAWLDAGTHESLLQAGLFVQAIQDRQGMMISCPEEIALQRGFINLEQFILTAEKFAKNEYGQYLLRLAEEFAG
jgi:glucose-1-phosphate thymidylyltransferase